MILIIFIIIIVIALKGVNREFLQSPHYLQHVHSSGQGTIACKSRAAHPSAYHVQRVTCHLVERDSSALKFDRVEISFILLYFIG